MSEKTRCLTCNKLLIECEEAHSVDGFLFCSQECATNYLEEDIRLNAHEQALERYDAEAEVVLTKDILDDEFEPMTADDILSYIKDAGTNALYYKVLYQTLMRLSYRARADILNYLASKEFKNAVDLEWYLEAGDMNE